MYYNYITFILLWECNLFLSTVINDNIFIYWLNIGLGSEEIFTNSRCIRCETDVGNEISPEMKGGFWLVSLFINIFI